MAELLYESYAPELVLELVLEQPEQLEQLEPEHLEFEPEQLELELEQPEPEQQPEQTESEPE